MSDTPENFLGIPAEYADYAKAKAVVIPVPFEATTSYAQGTAFGPAAILEASAQVELYDEETEGEPYLLGVATLPPIDFHGLSLKEAIDKIESVVKKVVADGKMPIVLGGEHSITPPAVRAVATKHHEITVVQLDAHADLRQEYEGTPLSHASAMARVRDQFPAVQIAIRALSKEEADWVKKDKLPVFFAHQLTEGWMDRAIAAIPTKKVYLTIDIDGLDGSLIPATGTPVPGGLTYRELVTFVRKLMREKEVVAYDVVELMPQEGNHASNFLAALIAAKCFAYWAENKR